MNTSIIKKESTDQGIQPGVKITRRITGNISSRKNDLVAMLQEENNSLYENYKGALKRIIELRAIVGKQQKLINAIYNAELNLLFPDEEKNTAELIKIEPVQQELSEELLNTLPVTESSKELLNTSSGTEPAAEPVTEPAAIEIATPEIKLPQPLGLDDLASRIRGLRRQKMQWQAALIEKAKFLLAIYNAPGGIYHNTLFDGCGITRITGLRYVSFFRKFSLVSSGGIYRITALGKKFVEGEPHPDWDKYNTKKWRKIN